jgi:chemotaxis protein histidine kinase CheA
MDIVKSHIEKLNGLIDIVTQVGKGTCFKIKLPLTLAIITGLLVKFDDQTLIIPMSNIAEIVRPRRQDCSHPGNHGNCQKSKHRANTNDRMTRMNEPGQECIYDHPDFIGC